MSMKWAYERAIKENVVYFLRLKQEVATTVINLNKLYEHAKEEGYNIEETYNEATHIVGIGCKVNLGQGTESDVAVIKKWCNSNNLVLQDWMGGIINGIYI